MLFFIDESWQTTSDGKLKIGVLSALQMKSHDFNECSLELFKLKTTHLGHAAANKEIKGMHSLRNYLFRLEASGIKSNELNLIRSVFAYIKTKGVTLFGSIVLEESEVDLSCADVNELERPFFFLFERIDEFMKENHPGLMAKIIFDDRGAQANKRISASVSNFFHKCSAGKRCDTIIKVPFFAISTENVGLQIADIVAYILGCSFTARKSEIIEFYRLVKGHEFKSRTTTEVNGKKYSHYGFKVIDKKKEAGDSHDPGRVI
ncbi:MAG: DUF3800 domain-containing protein [Syntrophorhabdaceae bacterium]|nr:DUF3800 domain-containing protein [Syntrophorhabdaceae bacterium]